MIKFAKVINEETKQCDVGLGTNTEYYTKLGMTEQDVEQAYNGNWYLVGYAPTKPEPTLKERLEQLEQEYQMNRWQREAILAPNSPYSDFTKKRAQELEDLAEQIRRNSL